MKKLIFYISVASSLSIPITGFSVDSRIPSNFVLPPLNLSSQQISGMAEIEVKSFVFEGNTLFTDAQLNTVVKSYQGRIISAAELQDVGNKLSNFYIDASYINSGALIPEQIPENGLVKIQIIEGKLSKVLLTVDNKRRLKDDYILSRLKLNNNAPLNTQTLQKNLQILQQNSLVKRFNAELGPGLTRGEAVLSLGIEEEKAYGYGFSVNNHRSPSVGAWRGAAFVYHDNLTGWGDSLSARYGLTQGLKDYSVDYRLPIPHFETSIELHADNTDSKVISEPFNQLNIKSESSTYGLTLRHPFYKDYSADFHYRVFDMSLGIQKKRSYTSLLDLSLNFSPGVQEGFSKITAVRFGQSWLDRSRQRLITISSHFSMGLDAFESTINDGLDNETNQPTIEPDSEFNAWLGRLRWVEGLSTWDSQLWLRADAQWSQDNVLSMEKFAIGGANTVRGYRENQLTRDKGVVLSIEWRIPVGHWHINPLIDNDNDGQIYIVPFADYGWGKNNGLSEVGPRKISSIGLGAIWQINKAIKAELFWGYALDDVETQKDKDIQDNGLHFSLSMQL